MAEESNHEVGPQGDHVTEHKIEHKPLQCIPDMKGLFNICFLKPSEETSSEELHDLFSKFGEVVNISAADHQIYIRYRNKESAVHAKEELGEKYGIFYPRVRRSMHSNPLDLAIKPEVFIGNIPLEATEEDITALMEGRKVVSLTLKNNPGQGYGFVVFATLDDALAMVRVLNEKEVHGKRLFARFNWQSTVGRSRSRSRSRSRGRYPAYSRFNRGGFNGGVAGGYTGGGGYHRPASPSPPRIRDEAISGLSSKGQIELFICGFPINTGDVDIQELFKDYGYEGLRRLANQAKYPNTGACVVMVMDIECAGKAIKHLNGSEFQGFRIKVRLTDGQVQSQYIPPHAYERSNQPRGRPRYRGDNMYNGYHDNRPNRGRPNYHGYNQQSSPRSPGTTDRPLARQQVAKAGFLVAQISSMMGELLDECPTCTQINNLVGELQQVIVDMERSAAPHPNGNAAAD